MQGFCAAPYTYLIVGEKDDDRGDERIVKDILNIFAYSLALQGLIFLQAYRLLTALIKRREFGWDVSKVLMRMNEKQIKNAIWRGTTCCVKSTTSMYFSIPPHCRFI